MYILFGHRSNGVHQRGGRDVRYCDGARLELVDVAAAPVARERDDPELRMALQQLAQKDVERAPVAGRDAKNGDVRAGARHREVDLTARADFGEDFEVGLMNQGLTYDVAEERRHGPEYDASRRHGCSVSGAVANARESTTVPASTAKVECGSTARCSPS